MERRRKSKRKSNGEHYDKHGAKPSCAAKIASAIEAGLLGMQMQNHGRQFYGGEGIILKGVENTIRNVSQLASQGMRETDDQIIKIMLG